MINVVYIECITETRVKFNDVKATLNFNESLINIFKINVFQSDSN
jgi:hypothetical protein